MNLLEEKQSKEKNAIKMNLHKKKKTNRSKRKIKITKF